VTSGLSDERLTSVPPGRASQSSVTVPTDAFPGATLFGLRDNPVTTGGGLDRLRTEALPWAMDVPRVAVTVTDEVAPSVSTPKMPVLLPAGTVTVDGTARFDGSLLTRPTTVSVGAATSSPTLLVPKLVSPTPG